MEKRNWDQKIVCKSNVIRHVVRNFVANFSVCPRCLSPEKTAIWSIPIFSILHRSQTKAYQWANSLRLPNLGSVHIIISGFPSIPRRQDREKKNNGFILSNKRFEEVDFFGFSDKTPTQLKSNINQVDFVTIVIPFVCLISVTMLICGVSMLRSSSIIPSSPRPAPYTPNIKITEPSSIAAPGQDVIYTDKFLSPVKIYRL